MTNPTPSPVGRAALLGTEHGTQAAQECLTDFEYFEVHPDWQADPRMWPQADLSRLSAAESYRMMDRNETKMMGREAAYKTAFTAAVESTIRQACQEVTQ